MYKTLSQQIFKVVGILLILCGGMFILMRVFGFYTGSYTRARIFPLFLSPHLTVDESLLDIPHEINILDKSIALNMRLPATTSGASDTVICIQAIFHNDALKGYDISLTNSHFYVNGGRVIGTQFAGYNPSFTTDRLEWCAIGGLKQGLHLIEFHLRDDSGETLHVQQWAIEVE